MRVQARSSASRRALQRPDLRAPAYVPDRDGLESLALARSYDDGSRRAYDAAALTVGIAERRQIPDGLALELCRV